VLDDGVVRVRRLREADVESYVAAFPDDPDLASLLGFEHDPDPADVQQWLGTTWTGPPELRSWKFAIAAARGRGVMTRALALVLDWAFGELALERMELTALPENQAVPHLAAKFGYVFEGTMRGRNFERGRRVDLLLWGLLREERRPVDLG
jgi:RimJ/RimL family protein N-acetyltransferase